MHRTQRSVTMAIIESETSAMAFTASQLEAKGQAAPSKAGARSLNKDKAIVVLYAVDQRIMVAVE